MKDSVRKVVADCCRTILTDEPWQDLGFAKRPRYGAFFQRWRATWKVALEKRALQEMLAALPAAYVIGGAASRSDIPEVVEAYAATQELADALGYRSRDHARQLLGESIDS